MTTDYKKTLNLPETSFPMKANLTQREPEMLRTWEEMDVYTAMVSAGNEKGRYVLHDGPPYANGHLHMGHALNKILKDFIVKSKNMLGYMAEYVPGWDCHGLPIELQVEHSLGDKKKELPAHVVRKRCRDWANKFIDIQRKEFKRLGVFGTWEDPYLSMAPAYEAATARELANFYENGSVVRSKKAIHWCISCHTALAEAEVEYEDHTSPSIYVRFPLNDPKIRDLFPKADPAKTFVLIWTTTPWTIPDNMAVAAHPELDYVLVEANGAFYLLAEGLLEANAKVYGWSGYEIAGRAKGADLEGLKARHPIYERVSPLVLGDHVTLEAGTGFVHTAPGHGREDYDTGVKYGLEIYSPMDDEGRFYDTVGFFAGMNVWEANPKVIEKLKEAGNLMASAKITHSYPHCWRCKEPVIFRATTQWFIQMEANNLRAKALNAIKNDVEWVPSWGEARIYSMIENRPDWCISRQRTWGVPIIALLCETCNEAWHDAAWAKDIASRFAKHPTGCDYWFETDLAEIVPAGLKCPSCGSVHWKKETDILDVWFDSGTSFAAVCEQRPECTYPANMYLEGSDQHRGWFHSSLLASIGTRGIAPYKEVLTHGYVVDGQGRKMSKSLGNGMAPEEIIAKYGAEILRMWVASADYREDIRISEEILSRQVDAYRRLRNTCRYILGNIGDFTPDAAVAEKDMDPLDRFAIDLVTRAHDRVQDAYVTYEFHKVFHTLHNLCATDLSAFYLDILKDRLYASAPGSVQRRSAQTAMWRILLLLLRAMAPVLSFTAEEVFRYLPDALKPGRTTVFALQAADAPGYAMPEAERAAWETMLAVRGEVSRALEPLRKEGVIGHGLDSRVTLYVDDALAKTLDSLGTDLRALFIVSQLVVRPIGEAPAGAFAAAEVPGLSIAVEKARGEKCERCWIYSEELNSDAAYPNTCPRCAGVLRAMNA
ncbi:isoleucyl-tRNA synthetase [uncultured delta proteobacterium]|uniref:Isoleucine--tRNA ligase n=1 Tax=uncultured delta proteobacterium TaxID=34034 RepID=A0A212IWD7_9DELT|nr:isoleucyl-tRNA synthetase [uncultured delta proteobacterium]